MILESLDGADPNDSNEDSLTEAIRRGEELRSGKVKGVSAEEFLAEFRAPKPTVPTLSGARSGGDPAWIPTFPLSTSSLSDPGGAMLENIPQAGVLNVSA